MVATITAVPIWAEQGPPALLALLHRAVFVVGKLVFRTHVLAAALETEYAALAVVAGQEG